MSTPRALAHWSSALLVTALLALPATAFGQAQPGAAPLQLPSADAGVPKTSADAGSTLTPPAVDAGLPATKTGDAGAGPGSGASVDAGPKIIAPPPHAAAIVTVALSSPEVVVGKRFSVFVIVEPGRKAKLDPSLNFGGAFDIGRRTFIDKKLSGGVVVREFEVEMIAWVVGDLLMPPFRVNYAHDGTAYSAQSKPTPIKVISFIGDGKEDLRDVAPPVPVKRRDWLVLYLISGLLGICILGVIGVFVTKRVRKRSRKSPRRRRERVAPAVLLRPDQEAFARLEALEHSGALDEDDRKPAYIELSEIFRNYLGRRFGFPALDLTTAEIKQRLAFSPETSDVVGDICAWLEEGDMVRYANHKPSQDEAVASINHARQFVTATWQPPKPVPVPVPVPVVPQPPSVAPSPASHDHLRDTLRDAPADPSEQWGEQMPAPPSAADTLQGMAAAPAAAPTASATSTTTLVDEPSKGPPDA